MRQIYYFLIMIYNFFNYFYRIQLFINWQAAAIKAADPGALVTVGTWSERSITDKYLNAS